MLIPYGSDTPIYYWPFATGALILVNILVFVLQASSGIDITPWTLAHGDGIHPLQWLTYIFLHAGFLHLLGNMIFLWAFGLVVEGKVGPWVFTGVYLGIGVVQSMLEQFLFLGAWGGHSLGASSAIYGIMIVSLFWAPQDNLKCILNVITFYVWFVDIPIFMFGVIYFLWDFTIAFFSNFSMGTGLLHVMGAMVGVVPGLGFLLLHWVDGEQRDLVSMIRELFGGPALVKKKSKQEMEQESQRIEQLRVERREKLQRCWRSLEMHLDANNLDAAVGLFREIKKIEPKAILRESLLVRLLNQYQKIEEWEKFSEFSKIYLENYHEREVQVRINLARVQVMGSEFPRQSLKTLDGLEGKILSEKQSRLVEQIQMRAKQMIDEGVIELGGE